MNIPQYIKHIHLSFLLLGFIGACSIGTSPEHATLGQQAVGDCTVTLSYSPI